VPDPNHLSLLSIELSSAASNMEVKRTIVSGAKRGVHAGSPFVSVDLPKAALDIRS
jgi:hypothetical protein